MFGWLIVISGRLFHSLGLWQRIALTITLGFLFLFTIFGLLSMRMINDSTGRILDERRVLAEMAADEMDAMLANGFYELEKATSFARFDPGAGDLGEELHMLQHAYGRVGTFSLGVQFLDARGKVILAEPPGLMPANVSLEPHLRKVLETGKRAVSDPFESRPNGTPAVALTVPIKNAEGTIISMLSGLIDISSSAFTRSIRQSTKLGATGHGEIVDAHGMIIASTEPGRFLRMGDHLPFYSQMMAEKKKGVANVPSDDGGEETDSHHIIAFVPLEMADWGVSLGGDDRETLAPVVALRNSIFFFGAGMVGVILAATLIGTRRLIRPIRQLTGAAESIAQEKLTDAIQIDEGGEIGVLGRSLERMRLKLKESLDSLRSWNTELEKRVEERTRELERLHHEIAKLQAMREAERMKAEFISGISHELRTPLGFIKGYITTLLRPELRPSKETQKEFLEIIREETEKLQALVENLLDTSRIQAGSFTIDKIPVNMLELTRKATEKAQVMTRLHSLAYEFDPLLPLIRGDPQRLEQVLQNLLDNAVKYSPGGGKITVSGVLENEDLVVSVADEGQGIPAEELDRIFIPFYRVRSGDGNTVRGVGLGLSICKAIVEAHGGRIWAESDRGRGSVFRFALPLDGEMP
ncbi:MAG: HAMP domain-containing protein [Chloroflexi bacterium]|nr:HAMP domain-containing protein [Chloroflexota bacterium]